MVEDYNPNFGIGQKKMANLQRSPSFKADKKKMNTVFVLNEEAVEDSSDMVQRSNKLILNQRQSLSDNDESPNKKPSNLKLDKGPKVDKQVNFKKYYNGSITDST
jgi:hypothetical protein